MKRIRNLLMCLAALALVGCAAAPVATVAPSEPKRLSVVATFSILGDLVQNVGGDDIDLHVLVGPDSDSHTYEPSPADVARVAEADLVFQNGLDFEGWLDELFTASKSPATRVTVTDGITAGKITVGDEAGETDPHAWQDVSYAMLMVEHIRDALVAADATHADTYKANAEAYLKQLSDLDAEIKQGVEGIPAENRKLVTNHDALGYFASRYGFEVIGSALGSVSTEAAEPSAADIARLVDEIKAAQVPTIFTENVENSKVVDQVAAEAGVAIGQPLYTDALSAPGTDGATYIGMMRANLRAIVAGLKP